jgi:hypothetical protein
MSGAEGVAKVCLVCGRDCTTVARVKDTQGRYTCKECYDKAKAARASAQNTPESPAPGAASKPKAPGNDNAFLLDLAPPPGQGEGLKPCPNCGASMKQDAVLCVTCGFNAKTGQRAQVKVLKPEKERGARGGGGGGGGISLEINPAVVVLGSVLVMGGLLAWGTQSAAGAIASIAVVTLLGLIATVMGVVQAFRQGDSLAGGLQIGAIFCGLLWFYTVYWMFAECESGIVKALWFTAFVLSAVTWGMVYLGPLGQMLEQAGMNLTP